MNYRLERLRPVIPSMSTDMRTLNGRCASSVMGPSATRQAITMRFMDSLEQGNDNRSSEFWRIEPIPANNGVLQ